MRQNLKLNETPIRTSRNYGINNISLENIYFPEVIDKFNGLEIEGKYENINIEEKKVENTIKYGNGEIMQNQIKQQTNKNLQIKIHEKNDLCLNFYFSKKNKSLVENIIIEAEKNSNGTVILRFISEDDLEYYHNGQIKVIAKENANLNVIILNLLNANTNSFIAIENIQKEKSNVKYITAELGGKNNIVNYYTNLEEKQSNNEISTIYLGKNDKIIDLNYIVEVYGEKCNVNMDIKGAITDSCKKHFKGTIDFKKGCKKSKGNENEYCTILSNKAKSIALPMLLCTEEDVEGNHRNSYRKNRFKSTILFND